MSIQYLQRSQAWLTLLDNGLIPLDCDVMAFDNSQSKRQGVSRTYKGMDGYAPMAADLGHEGLLPAIGTARRQSALPERAPAFLKRVLGRARHLTTAPLPLRPDGGNDAVEKIAVVENHNEQSAPAHHLIKWNPHQENPEQWLAYAAQRGDLRAPRSGKRVALFKVRETRTGDGYENPRGSPCCVRFLFPVARICLSSKSFADSATHSLLLN